MNKIQKFHHSVTENGKLQVRIVTEYQTDEGKVIDKKYGNPMTPIDTKDMSGWDTRSQDIVSAIIEQKVLSDFENEKQTKTGTGLEEIVTVDRVIEEDGRIAVRKIIRIFDEGVEVSKKYHRSWIMPGNNSDEKDIISKAIAKKLYTQAIIDEYKNKIKTIG